MKGTSTEFRMWSIFVLFLCVISGFLIFTVHPIFVVTVLYGLVIFAQMRLKANQVIEKEKLNQINPPSLIHILFVEKPSSAPNVPIIMAFTVFFIFIANLSIFIFGFIYQYTIGLILSVASALLIFFILRLQLFFINKQEKPKNDQSA
jgi:hypothetical protein